MEQPRMKLGNNRKVKKIVAETKMAIGGGRSNAKITFELQDQWFANNIILNSNQPSNYKK